VTPHRPSRAARTCGAGLSAGVALLVLLAACGGAPDAGAEAGIRETTARWEAALVAGDPAGAVPDVFTEDAMRLPSGEPAVRGRAAIADALAGSVPLAEAHFELEDIEVDGRLAYAAGTYRVRPSEGPVLTGKFLEVWKRTPDGWRIHRVMWD